MVRFLHHRTRSGGARTRTGAVPEAPVANPFHSGEAVQGGEILAHHLTVDVEEYFHATALRGQVDPLEWPAFESRVENSVDRLLEALEGHRTSGTFFVLGWLAHRRPHLVRRIHERGHEIASHGWGHLPATEQSPEEFRESVRSSRAVLEDITGSAVLGFRAPSFSIVPGREWALDVLIEEGYAYDSSLFPIVRGGYGYSDGSRDPIWIVRPAGRIAEFPPATFRVLGVNVPAGGGAYFRLFPYRLVRSALRRCEERGLPTTFYIHPWELDPGQPRLAVPWSTRLRHYTGLGRTLDRLHQLLEEFPFQPIAGSLHVDGREPPPSARPGTVPVASRGTKVAKDP